MTHTSSEDPERLLEAVRAALVDEVPVGVLDRISLQRMARYRSSLYFVSTDGPVPQRRWVLKLPAVDSLQADLEPPMSATAQYQAHLRLYEHLERLDGRVRAPRAVALLPDVDGYLMEYVAGSNVSSRLRLSAVRRPQQLLDAMVTSAEVLQAVHSLDPAEPATADLGDLADEARATAAELIVTAGLEVPGHGFFARVADARDMVTADVVLHGDFAPENVLLATSGVYCLDAALATRGAAERDVVRFLAMLFQADLLSLGAHVPQVQGLRRRAAAAFLGAYYADRPWPESLQPLMVLALAARYARRKASLDALPPLGWKRALMPAVGVLDRHHFQHLLDEVSAPGWPHALERAGLA